MDVRDYGMGVCVNIQGDDGRAVRAEVIFGGGILEPGDHYGMLLEAPQDKVRDEKYLDLLMKQIVHDASIGGVPKGEVVTLFRWDLRKVGREGMALGWTTARPVGLDVVNRVRLTDG